MASTARIIDSHGRESRLRVCRIKEFERDGLGRWRDGVFVFTPRADQFGYLIKPTGGRITSRLVDSFAGGDSGFNLLPYPMRSGITTQPDYPALARQGAGL